MEPWVIEILELTLILHKYNLSKHQMETMIKQNWFKICMPHPGRITARPAESNKSLK